MNEKKTRIILAENKELIRKALAALLRTKANLEVIAEASTGKELMDQLKKEQAQLVLLDSEISLVESREILKFISSRFQQVKVIILSDHPDDPTQSEFMTLGANGFLAKTCSEQTLFGAIGKVLSEGFFFDSSTSMALLSKLVMNKEVASRFPKTNFSNRETEIIKKICDGKTNKQIAASLHLSASTIDFYRTRIYSKAKCRNVTSLLKYALKTGLISLS